MILLKEFEEYLKQTDFSEKTVTSYVGGLKHYSTMYDEVNTPNVSEYKNRCIQIHKPRTINLRLCALAFYAKWQNIPLEVKAIQIQEPIFAESVLSQKEYNKILDYLLSKEQYDWYLLLRLLACTGLRISESYQVTFGDLKLTRKVIMGKGTKTRVIWFPLKFRKEIQLYTQGHKDKEQVVHYGDTYIRSKLKRLQKKLHIKCKLSPHEFRRFYARQIYKKTKDVYLVKDLLGHASIRTTMRYLRVSVSSVSLRMSRLVDW